MRSTFCSEINISLHVQEQRKEKKKLSFPLENFNSIFQHMTSTVMRTQVCETSTLIFFLFMDFEGKESCLHTLVYSDSIPQSL